MRLAPGRPSVRWWQRAVALCLAVWFVAVATDLPVVHACAMHGAAATGEAAAPHAGTHHATTPERDGAHGGACTCLGHCCGAAVLVPPTVSVVAAARATPASPLIPGRPYHEYVAAWADFVLPFSTAPPQDARV